MKTEPKNSFNIKDFSQLTVVITPFLSARGATICLVRDFDLAYVRNIYCCLFKHEVGVSYSHAYNRNNKTL